MRAAPSYTFWTQLGSGVARSCRHADQGSLSANRAADSLKTLPHCMRVSRQHRLDTVAGDFGQVGVVDAGGAEVGDVAVAALVGADV